LSYGLARTADVHIQSWSAIDGCRKVRCSSCVQRWCCFRGG
jgi:hypothetical protein